MSLTSALSRRGQRAGARRAVVGVLAGGCLIALSACTPFVHGGDDSGNTPISMFRAPMNAALKPYYAQKLNWKACSHHLECATVSAPLDWQHVSAQSIHLALVKHAASGQSLGSLLINPGGPGGSGVGLIEDSVGDAVDSTIAKRYDVIGFDPRGVGQSSAVKCFDTAGMDKYLYAIDPGEIGSATWIAAEKARSRSLYDTCEKNTGTLLDHIDTINAAHDMDVIRAALGEPKLDYLGYSYGTYLGTIYAGLYPTRVGKMVLDGADDPWGASYDPDSDDTDDSDNYSTAPADDGTVAQAQAFEGDLDAFLQSCLEEPTATVGQLRCPFSGTLHEADTAVSRELAAVDKHPLPASDGRRLGSATLASAIESALYDPTDWPRLTRMFTQLKSGNASIAFDFADEYNDRNSKGTYDDNADLANLAIGCLEDGSDVDLHYDRQELASLRKYAPVLGSYAAYGDLICSGWKYGPSPFPDPVHAKGTGPIIVVGSTGDPATPYADAKDLARQLDGGHLVTFHGEGHTAYDEGHSCIDGVVDDYLIDGTVPRTDPNCT